jgi:hypothetical protein
MIRRTISLTMICTGLLAMLGGLAAIAPSAAMAQVVPQPTPRPALSDDDDDDGPAVPDMSHITGTVIDQSSGAPLPNTQVLVGDQSVTTDQNGNYDLWIVAGSYTVTIVANDGTVQQSLQVELPGGQMVVQHLTRVSAAPPTAQPTVEPAAAPVVEAKSAPPEVTAVPTEEPVIASAPARLPRTAGNPSPIFSAWFWISLGLALFLGGLTVAIRTNSLRMPARALASYARTASSPSGDAAAFLAALLSSEIRTTASDDALLRALLDSNTPRRRAAQELLADLLSQ